MDEGSESSLGQSYLCRKHFQAETQRKANTFYWKKVRSEVRARRLVSPEGGELRAYISIEIWVT